MEVTIRSASLSKGPIRVVLSGLCHRENRTITDGASAKHQVYRLPYCDLMSAPHFTSFLSPIHILQRWHCFGFLESSSIDIFLQSHINHKHLKILHYLECYIQWALKWLSLLGPESPAQMNLRTRKKPLYFFFILPLFVCEGLEVGVQGRERHLK